MGTATDAFVKEKKTPLPSWSFRFLWNVKKCQIVAKKCKTILPWRILLLVLNTFQSIQRKKKKLSSQITHHIRKKRKLSLAFFTSSRNSFMSPSNHFKPSYRNGMLTIFPFNDKRSREKINFFPIKKKNHLGKKQHLHQMAPRSFSHFLCAFAHRFRTASLMAHLAYHETLVHSTQSFITSKKKISPSHLCIRYYYQNQHQTMWDPRTLTSSTLPLPVRVLLHEETTSRVSSAKHT